MMKVNLKFALIVACDYVIECYKNRFNGDHQEISTMDFDCSKAHELDVLLSMQLGKMGNLSLFEENKSPTKSHSLVDKSENELSMYFFNDPIKDFKEGMVFNLNNIYYKYDDYTVSNDASEDLDNVVSLMKKYPDMVIMLTSHTDSRASKRYNRKLSERRAKEARAYIIMNGINGNRVKAIGFGEMQPVNHCTDGVECSESEHQENRRTEVKILRLN